MIQSSTALLVVSLAVTTLYCDAKPAFAQASNKQSSEKPTVAGLFTKVSGNVLIIGEGDKSRKAELLRPISDGEAVRIPKSGSIEIVFPSTNTYQRKTVPGDWRVSVSGFEDQANTDSETISKLTKVNKGLASQVRLGASVARSGESEQPTVVPIPGSKVHPKDPVTFTWPASKGAATYKLTFDPKLGGKKVYTVTSNNMNYDDTFRRSKYTWGVTAVVNGDEKTVINNCSFSVLRPSELETADELQRMEMSDNPGRVAVAALVYENLSLYNRAVGSYEKLIKLRPEAAPAYAALAELYGKMGRADDSKRMRKEAEKLGFRFDDKDK